jgi:hypothetical protein
MLTQEKAEKIMRLLKRGKASQREIARRLGVSRATVERIAWPKPAEPPGDNAPPDDCDVELPPPRRCRTCGGLVHGECRLCRVRRLVADGCIDPPSAAPGDPVRLELKEKHQARYAEVRERFERLCQRSAERADRRRRNGR